MVNVEKTISEKSGIFFCIFISKYEIKYGNISVCMDIEMVTYIHLLKKLLWTFNHHIAFNKKWPFIKIGFYRIWPLYDKEKF